jgi:hypothetical protein
MVRVEIADETLRYYVLGLLGSRMGQLLLRKDKSGSVIDHITVEHVASLHVPMLPDATAANIAKRMCKAVQLRETARLGLAAREQSYEAVLPAIPSASPTARGWSIAARELAGRVDAAPYMPVVRAVRKALKANGGAPLGEIATALKPPGRYKTVYVDRDHGVPILSGSQLLQIRPLNPRYMAARALKSASNGVSRKSTYASALPPAMLWWAASARSRPATTRSSRIP